MKLLELLDNSSKWIKYHLGETAKGYPVPGYDPSAVCWCLRGAVQKCYPENITKVEGKLRRTIARMFPRKWKNNCVADFNNDPKTTFALIRRVIKAAKV